MVKCSMHCCQKHQGTLLKTTFFALPKVKPLNDRKTAKAREGKLKAVISNKQCTAWINVINKSCTNNQKLEIFILIFYAIGEASENRIKEVKMYVFRRAIQLKALGNFFRLFISSFAYKMFMLIKQ